MIPPRVPGRGEEILPWAKQVAEYLRALTPRSGPGVRVETKPSGSTFSSDPGGKGASTGPIPLTPYQVDDTHVGVRPGTVMALYETSGTVALVPTLAGTALDAVPPPSIAVTLGSTNRIYIKASLSPGPAASLIKYQYLAAEPMEIDLHTSYQSDDGDSYADEAGEAWLYLGYATTDATRILSVVPRWTGGNAAYAWTNMGHFWGRQ